MLSLAGEGQFLLCGGLMPGVGLRVGVIPAKDLRGDFRAEAAVRAGVVHIPRARDVFRNFVILISHCVRVILVNLSEKVSFGKTGVGGWRGYLECVW